MNFFFFFFVKTQTWIFTWNCNTEYLLNLIFSSNQFLKHFKGLHAFSRQINFKSSIKKVSSENCLLRDDLTKHLYFPWNVLHYTAMYTKMKIEKVQQIWFISISVWNPKDVIIMFHCNCKQLLIYFCVWRRVMFVGSLSFFFSRLSIEVNFNLIEVQSVFREVIDFLQVSRSLLRRNGIYLQNIWTFASNSNFTVWKINDFSAAI